MRILIVEDDVRIAEQLERDLVQAGHVCFGAIESALGLEAVHRFDIEFVLLDLMLFEGSGFEFLEALRKMSSIPVIVLTAKLSHDDKVRALDLGADDYVTKPFWSEELLARIRSVMRRHQRTPQVLSTRCIGSLEVDLRSMSAHIAGEDCKLTPTEFDLLAYFLQRPNQALRSERLLQCVLNDDDARQGTLQVHISRLRRKLSSEGKRLETVWGIGYRFRQDL